MLLYNNNLLDFVRVLPRLLSVTFLSFYPRRLPELPLGSPSLPFYAFFLPLRLLRMDELGRHTREL